MLFSSVSNAISIPLGEAAPEFSILSMDGDPVTLNNMKGKVAVLIYWRTDHKRSLLALMDGMDVINSMKGSDLKVISIIAGTDDKDQARRVMRENNIDIPILVDNGRKLYSDYGIRVYPTTIIIDREGIISKDIPSHPLTYKKLLEGYIRKALGEIDEAGLKEIVSGKREKKDDATLEAERLYNLAMKFTKSGLQDMAINTAQKAVLAKPDMPEPYILLGFLKLDSGAAEEALSANRTWWCAGH
jgi:peroxiredoxin